MSSESNASDLSALTNVGNTGNSYGFTTGLGNIDPSSGMNSLNAGLVGAGAGTLPNGYLNGASNYITDSSGVGVGSLNGNTSFTMPTSSMSAAGLANALGMGSKLGAGSGAQQPTGRTGGGIRMQAVNFGSPIADFAGSSGGSQNGNGILQLLAKYHPGS